MKTKRRQKIRRANGPRRVRARKPPVFAYYCTIIFDNMAPPWGVGWRKCDPRSYTCNPPDVSRGVRKLSEKIIDLLMPFWLAFGSTWLPFWHHFGMFFRFMFGLNFRCAFLLTLAPFVLTLNFEFDALAHTPCDFSSFRHVAKSTNTTPTYPQHWFQNPPHNHKHITNKSIKKCI